MKRIDGQPVTNGMRRKIADAPVNSKWSRMGLHKLGPAKGKTGKAIRAARRKAGLAAGVVAAHVNCSPSTVLAWERGRSVSPKYHEKIIEFLKLPKDLFS